ncbi:MAG TPA: ABC transporter ATP-binding protein [Candidatus Binataceae bacterium]|nr:ABC transporter ATP-binding protein [Candidatus Binataceae bacterium]
MPVSEIAAPPAQELSFPHPHHIRSRDIFRLYSRIWPFVKPYRRHLMFLMFAILPLALPVGVIAVAIARILFDVIGNGHPLTRIEAFLIHAPLDASRQTVLMHLVVTAAIVGAIVLPIVALGYGYVVWILQQVTNLFRVDLYARLQDLSLRFHGEEKIGDAMFRMFQDSAVFSRVIATLVMRPLLGVPFIVADLIWLALLNRPMAILLALLIPAAIALAVYYSASLRRAFVTEREGMAHAITRIEETLASIKTVKSFGTEENEGAIYARDNWDAFMAARRARMMFVRYKVINNTMLGIAQIAAIWLGARQVLLGGAFLSAAASLGTFQGTLVILKRSTKRTADLVNDWGALQDTTIAMARVLEFLATQGDSELKSGSELPPSKIDALRFERASFSYDGGEPVLRDVSLEARAGKITAVAGESGSGKSTMLNLMLRFFDPASGKITANGIDIRDFQLVAWRGVISVALQENPLFAASIRDNIAYSNPAASEEQILVAARRAGLEPYLRSLPDRLHTLLGEQGSKLSTGQAQRIGLARALLRDAQILLLDEPTASLDGATERQVLAGIREWIDEAPTRMVIVVTHRGTTAALADTVFRLDAGQIVASDSASLDITLAGESNA